MKISNFFHHITYRLHIFFWRLKSVWKYAKMIYNESTPYDYQSIIYGSMRIGVENLHRGLKYYWKPARRKFQLEKTDHVLQQMQETIALLKRLENDEFNHHWHKYYNDNKLNELSIDDFLNHINLNSQLFDPAKNEAMKLDEEDKKLVIETTKKMLFEEAITWWD